MNYYGTKEYKSYMEEFERRIFSKIQFDDYERIKELGEGYSVKYYYYADEENRKPGHAALDGQICRLYKNDELVFEWKNTDGNSRVADLIHHSDGNTYFIFDEDLYGYSVLNLGDLQCMHYIPAQSYGKYPEEFEETFLWCKCYYNPENNLLAVDGCYWACPYSLIVLDFSHPMTAVEAEDWVDVFQYCGDHPDLDDIDFVRWEGNDLVCKAMGETPEDFNLKGLCNVRFSGHQ